MTATTEGIEGIALADLERRQANGVRYGTIAEVDLAKARVKIKSGNITTTWLPWAAGRASGAKRRWDPPEVGEQVAVISPGGDLTQGLVIPGVYQESAGAPSASADKDSTVYSDGTVIEYDRATHALTADLQGTKVYADRSKIELTIGATKLTLTSSGATLNASSINLVGNVSVTGNLTNNGKNVGSTHMHSGVTPGPSTTGAPT